MVYCKHDHPGFKIDLPIDHPFVNIEHNCPYFDSMDEVADGCNSL